MTAGTEALEERILLGALASVSPPAVARRIAARALEVRRELPPSKRGGYSPTKAGKMGIGSGVKRAVDIAAGHKVNAMQVHRFFARWHNKIDSERAAGKTVRTSKTIMAGDLWGGFPMWYAAKRALEIE